MTHSSKKARADKKWTHIKEFLALCAITAMEPGMGDGQKGIAPSKLGKGG